MKTFVLELRLFLAERATLILADYSPDLLRRALREILMTCSGLSWPHSMRKLERYFRLPDRRS